MKLKKFVKKLDKLAPVVEKLSESGASTYKCVQFAAKEMGFKSAEKLVKFMLKHQEEIDEIQEKKTKIFIKKNKV